MFYVSSRLFDSPPCSSCPLDFVTRYRGAKRADAHRHVASTHRDTTNTAVETGAVSPGRSKKRGAFLPVPRCLPVLPGRSGRTARRGAKETDADRSVRGEESKWMLFGSSRSTGSVPAPGAERALRSWRIFYRGGSGEKRGRSATRGGEGGVDRARRESAARVRESRQKHHVS